MVDGLGTAPKGRVAGGVRGVTVADFSGAVIGM